MDWAMVHLYCDERHLDCRHDEDTVEWVEIDPGDWVDPLA